MARLTAEQRRHIPRTQFGNPKAAPGHGSFPMPDKAHVRSALSYIRYADPATAARIRAKAKKMFGVHD